MPIDIFPTAPSLNTSNYLHGVDEIQAIRSGVIDDVACTLDLLGTCRRDIPAFGFLADEFDDYKNDFRSFIFEIPANSTIVAKLIQISPVGVETEITIVDDTFGDLFATGTVLPNTWMFILRWFRVLDDLGGGCFRFNVVIENSSNNILTDFTTPCFKLRPWTCANAHRTVKITTEQRGYIVDGFDYRGISFFIPLAGGIGQQNKTSFPQETRWYGRFSPTTPTYINDTNLDSFRNEQQIQSQIVENYELRFDDIYNTVADPFFRDEFLAGEIFVSDYWFNAWKRFDHVRVNPVDISDRRVEPLITTQNFTIELEDFRKATLKRH